MKIAVIGCGYVAEFYAKTLGNYPELELIGAYDRNDQKPAGVLPIAGRSGVTRVSRSCSRIRRLSLF